MIKLNISIVDVVKWTAIIVLDLCVFMFYGVIFMGYEDTYDHLKEGDCWDYSNMNLKMKVILFCFYGWIILNIIELISIGRKVYKLIKSNTNNSHLF